MPPANSIEHCSIDWYKQFFPVIWEKDSITARHVPGSDPWCRFF